MRLRARQQHVGHGERRVVLQVLGGFQDFAVNRARAHRVSHARFGQRDRLRDLAAVPAWGRGQRRNSNISGHDRADVPASGLGRSEVQLVLCYEA